MSDIHALLPDAAVDPADADHADQASPAAFFTVEIRCPRPRYIRGGITFTRGRQTLENVPADLLNVLHADTCLDVLSFQPAAAPSGGTDVQNLGDNAGTDGDVTPAEIHAALEALVARGDPQSFTRSGVPSVRAVCDVLGRIISKAQLDAAWAERQP